jgi:hypothetical protein
MRNSPFGSGFRACFPAVLIAECRLLLIRRTGGGEIDRGEDFFEVFSGVKEKQATAKAECGDSSLRSE